MHHHRMLFVALFLLGTLWSARSVEAQNKPLKPGDVKWTGLEGLTDDDKEKLTNAIKLATIVMEKKDKKKLNCPKRKRKKNGGRLKLKKDKKTGVSYPYNVSKKKTRLVKKGATPGTSPPHTGDGVKSTTASSAKFSDLGPCAAKTPHKKGTNSSGGAASSTRATSSKTGITFCKDYLSGIPNSLSDATNEAQVKRFLSFTALLMHEAVHTKQSKPSTNPAEYAGWHTQYLTMCWIESWLDTLIGDTAEPTPEDKETTAAMASALGVGSAGQTTAQAAGAIKVKLATCFAAWKVSIRDTRDTFAAVVPSGGPSGSSYHAVFFGEDRVVAKVTTGASPSYDGGFGVNLQLPIDSVSWAVPATVNGGLAAVIGGGSSGQSTIVTILDGADDDELPDQIGGVITVSGDISGDLGYAAADASGTVRVFVLDRSLGATKVVVDSDGDGVVDTPQPSLFASHPSLSLPGSDIGRIDIDSSGATRVSVRTTTTDAFTHYVSSTAKDLDGDGVAEVVVIGSEAAEWASPRSPTIMSYIPPTMEPVGPDYADAFLAGVTEFYVDDGNVPGETVVATNLSQQTLIGVITAQEPDSFVAFPVAGGLNGGDLVRVSCLSTGNQTTEFVPFSSRHERQQNTIAPHGSQEFIDNSWDFDGDSLRDYVGVFGPLLYVGLSDAAGNVTSTSVIVTPETISSELDFEEASLSTISSSWTDEDTVGMPSEAINQLQRIAGAPSPGVAFGGYDIDGDGSSTDALVVVEDSSGTAHIHFGIDVVGSVGVWGAVSAAGGPSTEVQSYRARDVDGDGDVDVIFLVYDSAQDVLRPEMYAWDSDGLTFIPTNRPLLEVGDAEFPASGPIEAIYTLEMETTNEPISIGYTCILSLSGTDPGFNFGAVHVPINYDALTQLTVDTGNSSNFVDFVGSFDGGHAQAELCVPAGILAQGVVIYAAYGAFVEGASTFLSASNPVRITITGP